jgi:hypothetical protein
VTNILKFPRWQVDEDFQEWRKLHKTNTHQRFGQWFCNKHSITNSTLFYQVDPHVALDYIFANLMVEV